MRQRQTGLGLWATTAGPRAQNRACSGGEPDCRLTEYGGLEGTYYREDGKTGSYPLKDPSLPRATAAARLGPSPSTFQYPPLESSECFLGNIRSHRFLCLHCSLY